jgi:NAD(P)-dependent dehydrogenase (short-subunit alcohol dehydrogenase family)
MIHLKDKIVVVVGGNGLLGKEFIKQIAASGGFAINADIHVETDLEKGTFQCNITEENSIKDLIAAVLKKHGRIDGWVNTAYPRTKDWGQGIDDIDFESWRQNVDLHMNSYFISSKLAVDAMLPNKKGSIINISSIYGVVGPDFTVYEGTTMTSSVIYAAIKGGIINFTRFMASYYGKSNIRVNTISPGGIFDHQNPIFVDNFNKKVPMKRMGTAEDIAPAVVYLLSDFSSYLTGQNLIIDGGWTCI